MLCICAHLTPQGWERVCTRPAISLLFSLKEKKLLITVLSLSKKTRHLYLFKGSHTEEGYKKVVFVYHMNFAGANQVQKAGLHREDFHINS